jgi:hypothetical protein
MHMPSKVKNSKSRPTFLLVTYRFLKDDFISKLITYSYKVRPITGHLGPEGE